jgi:predicted enzyme related to lactoylglutathione lyase
MTFQIKQLTTIRLLTHDVAKSRAWYKSLFNLEPIEDAENFVSFRIGEVNFDITLADSKNPHSTGGTVGYWLVDNIDMVLERVKELGGELYRGPLKVKATNRIIMQIKDPMGNVVGFEALLS